LNCEAQVLALWDLGIPPSTLTLRCFRIPCAHVWTAPCYGPWELTEDVPSPSNSSPNSFKPDGHGGQGPSSPSLMTTIV
jgi:hypothetical protein